MIYARLAARYRLSVICIARGIPPSEKKSNIEQTVILKLPERRASVASEMRAGR
jgi:hypothetical protein